MTLDEIAIKCGTDKSTVHHGYTLLYEQYFECLRNEPINILELGWGGHEDPNKGGESAAMWREYFPKATVSVIDITDKINPHKGVNFYHGSQSDADFLKYIHDKHGDFDIIIDDASHISSLTIKSWEILYPMLKSGGIYVLEDTHSSYHSWFYGNNEANLNPDKNTIHGKPTALNYFKRMADEANFKGRSEFDLFPAKYHKGFFLEFVHFYFNIIFIKKR